MRVNKADAFVDDGRHVILGELLVMDVRAIVVGR